MDGNLGLHSAGSMAVCMEKKCVKTARDATQIWGEQKRHLKFRRPMLKGAMKSGADNQQNRPSNGAKAQAGIEPQK